MNSRTPHPKFLIVCEGQTERLYLRSFEVYNVNLKILEENASPLERVKEAIRLKEEGDYGQVWCVFDFDVDHSNPAQGQMFNQAMAAARQNGVKCAYSNDSFELWFILHYNFTDQELTRNEYYLRLGRLWDMNYIEEGKKRSFSAGIYKKLQAEPGASQEEAIARAKRLYDDQSGKECHLQNPVTTVFQLVELLNAHLRK